MQIQSCYVLKHLNIQIMPYWNNKREGVARSLILSFANARDV